VGPSAARNIGVQFSKGDFVLFLDADDLLYPNAIELNLYYFTVYKNAAFVSGGHDRVDHQGNILPGAAALVKAGDNYWALLQGNYIAMEATVLYRRELFFRFHFDPAIRACEDYDLNLQIARHFPVFGHTEKLAAYRIHGDNRSHDKEMMFRSAMDALGRQEKLLRNDHEKQAFRLGMKNWYNFYSGSAE
jgi:glycosyltransferase involved in cell wall biosynthesis